MFGKFTASEMTIIKFYIIHHQIYTSDVTSKYVSRRILNSMIKKGWMEVEVDTYCGETEEVWNMTSSMLRHLENIGMISKDW